MWWDLSAIACAVLAIAIRLGWDDDRGPRVSAVVAYLSVVCSSWSAHRQRWLRRRAESEGEG